MPAIETSLFAEKMRGKIINPANRAIMLSRIAGSEQESDLQVPPNCGGLGRIRHFKSSTSTGWPSNPLPILPACKALGLPPANSIEAQVFQNNACAWRCWYCFVPYKLLGGDEKVGQWTTPERLIELYLAEPGDRPKVIDLSGGSPDLTPEWIVWMMEALEKAGLSGEVYLWSDDNLSTDYTFTKLSTDQLAVLQNYRQYGRVCCFKGFDEGSFSFNTKAANGFPNQFELFRRLLDLGLDLYAYATFTGPTLGAAENGVPDFIDRLQAIHPNLPLRTVPLEIQAFGPTKARLQGARKIPAETALQVQNDAIARWNSELASRFGIEERSRPITEVAIR